MTATASPNITLTTDFATRDGYAGAMTGVILRQCPTARVVAITHDVPPRDIRGAAWALRNAWKWFPTGTIHVAVVDPGVGSDRRAILVRVARQTFIGPDNGLIPEAIRGEMIDAVREISNPAARALKPNPTFHGRDIFAWAAGWVASGHEWPAVGAPLDTGALVRLSDSPPKIERLDGLTTITGRVLLADRFGNLVTTITEEMVETFFGAAAPEAFVDGRPIYFGTTFSDVAEGTPLAYVGSSGYIEIAVNGGSARDAIGGSPEVALRGKKGAATTE